LRLFGAIFVSQKRRFVREAPPIANRSSLQNISVVINLKRYSVRNPWVRSPATMVIIELALVLKSELFPWMSKEDRIVVWPFALEHANSKIAFGNRIRAARLFLSVYRIDLLPKHCAF
jgi:hypothetical protein